MKAIVLNKHGGLECVSVADIDKPKLSDSEVLVQVLAAALNHLDIWVRKGGRGLGPPMPHVLGSDASGVVIEVGHSAKNVRTGDEVILNPGISCGKCASCRRGQQSECVSFGILGLSRPGTFAEFVSVPATNVYPKPPHLDFNKAAALSLVYLTAWRMLFTRAQLKKGELLLIHGIGGGVALAGLQLAVLAGAKVIVTSSSDQKLSRAIELGASHGINYKTVADLPSAVMEITTGQGVDVVMDTIGAAAFPVDLSVVRRGGRIVLCGVTSGASAQLNLQQLYWNQLSVLGSTMGSDEDYRQMLTAVSRARLAPLIDSVYPLLSVRDAMAKMEQGLQFGKIVLSVRD